jgi:glutathione peroxidase
MNPKQKFLKKIYSLVMWTSGLTGKKKVIRNESSAQPRSSIYDLNITLINGKETKLESFKGKKILLVNTASDCGYTGQYESLQKLWDHKKDELVVIGFPANDFKNQEPGSNNDIEKFCTSVYHLTFPITQKCSVLRSPEQHPVYRWLSSSELNGWNDKPPKWNFTKYLVDENGVLTHYFDAGIDPLGEEITKAISGK